MTTLSRTNSRANPPLYKDYVNFLAAYKNGKKDDDPDNVLVPPVSNFTLSSSSSSTSSSSLSSDVTDFSKSTCSSYNAYLETARSRKFGSVKPNLEEKNAEVAEKVEEKTTKKSEIVIEIQPTKSVSEVSKMFELKEPKKVSKSSKMNTTINIFEKQISVERKPKIAEKPAFCKSPTRKIETTQTFFVASPPPQVNNSVTAIPPPPPQTEVTPTNSTVPPPPPMPSATTIPKPTTDGSFPPPPPPFSNSTSLIKPAINGKETQPPFSNAAPVKLQATLTKGPQTRYSVNQNGAVPTQIDRNDPMVKKLVYGTLRGLYGAYHDKATDMLATLPKNMVVRSNGVQDRIEQIAANGDLDKLNGRVNPKVEQE